MLLPLVDGAQSVVGAGVARGDEFLAVAVLCGVVLLGLQPTETGRELGGGKVRGDATYALSSGARLVVARIEFLVLGL